MKAKEMFEDLGFRLRIRTATKIVWTRKVRDDFIEKEIIFNLEVAKVSIEGGWVTKDEMLAVSKQCEELGWFESEQNQETNYEHFKKEILECCVLHFAVVKGKPKRCNRTKCSNCEFIKGSPGECHKEAAEWLKQPCKAPTIKLTKFENDLLQSYSKGFLSGYEFKKISTLNRMKRKGHFKGVDEDATIEDILADCEVTEED